MLPVESLKDVVAFFQYFDLGLLLLTSKQFSDLARQVTGTVRISNLSGFDFVVGVNDYYYVYSRDVSIKEHDVHSERFSDEGVMAEFVSEAFRHCVVGNLEVDWWSGRVFSALKEGAKTVIVTDTLTIEVEPSVSIEEVVDFVGTFQRVNKLTIVLSQQHSRDTKCLSRGLRQIEDLCQRKNIDWVEHWMSS